jgi:hypothetical protein
LYCLKSNSFGLQLVLYFKNYLKKARRFCSLTTLSLVEQEAGGPDGEARSLYRITNRAPPAGLFQQDKIKRVFFLVGWSEATVTFLVLKNIINISV